MFYLFLGTLELYSSSVYEKFSKNPASVYH